MDKGEFAKNAPMYYALAIVSRFLDDASPTTRTQLIEHFSDAEEDSPGDRIYRIRSGILFELALQMLVDAGLVTLERDVFGPPVILPVENFTYYFDIYIDIPVGDMAVLFSRYSRVGRYKDAWLREALEKLASEQDRLNIQDSDFESPDTEWAPIPLDRNEPEIQAVIVAVDKAIETIRSDNGYAATMPNERDYVIDGLVAFRGRLREATTTTIPYIRKYVIEPLSRATKSLGRSATNLAIEVVRARLKEWLMKQGVPWPFDWT